MRFLQCQSDGSAEHKEHIASMAAVTRAHAADKRAEASRIAGQPSEMGSSASAVKGTAVRAVMAQSEGTAESCEQQL